MVLFKDTKTRNKEYLGQREAVVPILDTEYLLCIEYLLLRVLCWKLEIQAE